MKWSIIQEADRSSSTNEERYHEVIEEISLADKVGFHAYGTSEQHFFAPKFTVSAPEVLYAAIAMRTERIILRPMIAVPMTWHHPILIAERLAAVDILSRGRVELATGRGNNLNTLKVFGIDPSETRAIYAEAMDALENIFSHPSEAEHHGKYWDFSKTEVIPQLIGARYPKMSMAAASVESHVLAGERGYGVISFENYFGFDFLQECIDAYRKTSAETTVAADKTNEFVGLCVGTAFCASTTEKARELSGPEALDYFQTTLDVYRPMASQPGYAYMDRINTLLDKSDDLDWLCENTSVVMVGTPDDYIRRAEKLEAMGVEEIVLRIDGLPHEHIMESLELIGREVIPATQ
ncbi:LLM class flavin-dependent oxidoreductase [Mycolicibacterium baixiangningiae]|uniref:LLM class flavin-dependent oxidoreductase n=1 Tax=Mycolicibacterium baixiangningiae TaxID=2761578 RepID=UPI0018D07FAF|nr:LLM class flavin-dependent oxidoreductase [Mycolicibacterium baixiangningiae]